jgi:hypothetical protein
VQHAGEVVVGELAGLVGIEDVGLPVAERVLQGSMQKRASSRFDKRQAST